MKNEASPSIEKDAEKDDKIGMRELFEGIDDQHVDEYLEYDNGLRRYRTTDKLRNELKSRLNKFVAYSEGKISEKFFEDAFDLVQKYMALDLGPNGMVNKNPGAELMKSKIGQLLRTPALIKDQRFLKVLEQLTELGDDRNKDKSPHLTVNMFDRFIKEEPSPIDGFDVNDIDAIERIIEYDKLWSCGKLARYFLSSIARIVERLAESNHEKTWPIRMKLLEQCSKHPELESSMREILKTFKSKGGKSGLTEKEMLDLKKIFKESDDYELKSAIIDFSGSTFGEQWA